MYEVYRPRLEGLGLWKRRPPFRVWWQILNRRIFVIVDERTLVGTIGLYETSMELFVFLLAISPDGQGRGLGRALIDFAEARARLRGYRRLSLATPEVFVEAIGFYRRLGFVEIGRESQRGVPMVVFLKRWDVIAPRP